MNPNKDFNDLLYELMQERKINSAKNRITSKTKKPGAIELKLDYSDKDLDDVLVLAEKNQLLIRYTNTEGVGQDALALNAPITNVNQKLVDNTLTLHIEHGPNAQPHRSRS